MDIRKVQMTGGSSFVISLPKNWVKKQNVQKNDPIGVITQADGTLILTPNLSYDQAVREIDFPLKDYQDPDYLLRSLIGAYITGYTLIKVTSAGRIPPKVRSVVRRFTQITIGQEVAEETDNSILLKDILNPSEMPFENTIRRMYVIVKGMHEDALSALEQGRTELADDVISRDADVNRLHWLVHRQYLLLINTQSLARKMEITPLTASMYYKVSRLLEQAGDQAVVMGQSVNSLIDAKADHRVISQVRQLGDISLSIFNDSIKAIYANDLNEVNSIINRFEMMQDEYRNFASSFTNLKAQEIIAMTTIGSVMFRLTEYGAEIAEIVINHEIGSKV